MASEQESTQKVIVCLPVYNEESSVGGMIEEIRQSGWDVFITDGGSTDNTIAIAEQKGVRVLMRKGKGKGFGMKQGIDFAEKENYDILVFIDCDMTYPVNKIGELVALVGTCDMAVGARKMSMVDFVRRVANYLFTGWINFLFGTKFKDTQSGLRAVNVKRFIDVITAQGFDVETEIMCKAIKRCYKVTEVEIDYFPRVGKSKANFTDSFLVILQAFKIRVGYNC